MNRHKLAVLTMLGAYPTIVTLLAVLGPLMGDAPMPLKAAVLVPLMVGLLTYVVMPLMTWLFAGWLHDQPLPLPRFFAAGIVALLPASVVLADQPQTGDETVIRDTAVLAELENISPGSSH